MQTRRFYVVRSVRPNGSVTYNCPTAEWALRKLRNFVDSGDTDITVLDPDGRPLSEADLISVVTGNDAEPAEKKLSDPISIK